MQDMTEEEAFELDDELTRTTPKLTDIEGPFIQKHRNSMLVALDHFSASYLQSRMLSTKQSPTELIHDMIRREMAL